MLPDVRRILIIKLRAIGDVLLATPVIENVRRACPDAHLAFLTERASEGVVDENPFLDEVIILDRVTWQTLPVWARLREQVAFYQSLRSRGFDLAIDLFGNPRSAILTALSGARHRVGFAFRVRRHLYNIVVTPRGGSVHEVEFNLDALRAIEMPIHTTAPLFPVSSALREEARTWLDAHGVRPGDRLVGLNPGGGWVTKRWTPQRFAGVADALIREYGAHVLLLWGPGERPLVDIVTRAMRSSPLILPETTLKGLGAFLSWCTLMISNDSGPMHIAAAMGIPTIGIFGPTNPALQGPYGQGHTVVRQEGLPCLGCNLLICRIGHLCMQTLPEEAVLRAVNDYFGQDA